MPGTRSILTAILALAAVMTPLTALTAQTRAAVASSTQPRPFATRAMGYPASVQPVGLPRAARPAVPITHLFWMAAPVVVVPVPVVPTGRVMVLVPQSLPPWRCAVVEVRTTGRLWRSRVALPALGAETPESLGDVIARMMRENRQVPLVSTNGTRLLIPAGPGVLAPIVYPCDEEIER
jgi:hypothetical protein